MAAMTMDDPRSRALLATALHPSSNPNERLMALAALGRALARTGLHPGDMMLVPASRAGPANDGADARETIRREAEIQSLTRRVKAQEKALRESGRETALLHQRIATLEDTLSRREDAMSDDACQIAALEADLAARDRRITALEQARQG